MNCFIIFSMVLLFLLSGAFVRAKSSNEYYGTIIGIDLGTTYSCVGLFKSGRVEIITNDQGNRITPSYVAFAPDGHRLIGDAAKNQLTTNPENTVFDVKRMIGRDWNDTTVRKDMQMWPFKVINKENKPYVSVAVGEKTKTFAPEEISAMVLGKMKEIAEAYLGKKIEHAVITVPAYFNDAQRQATKDAGAIAGLNVVRIINEPTAAALAYGFDKMAEEKTILVYDLGGGTFDVTLLTIDHGVFEVLATNGDTHLGGEDFDQRIMAYLMDVFEKKKGKNIRGNNRAVQKLRREVEKAKRALSSELLTRIEIESLYEKEDFEETLTRTKFEELNIDLFRSTLDPVKKVLQDAGVEKTQVDEIVLVGGSTRIPKIQQLLKDFFDGKELHRGVNPDEAVAYGAAIQAGVIAGDDSTGDLILLDVCPLSLGTGMVGDVFSVVIPRNTIVPTEKTGQFTTIEDFQTAIRFVVYEGERKVASKNHKLGEFTLRNIIPAPRGVPIVFVTFEIDANGILTVTAKEQGTDNKNKIVINRNNNRLSKEDVERMIRDAARFADKDQSFQEQANARNELESTVYKLRNRLLMKRDGGGSMDESDREIVEKIIDEKLEWLNQNKHATVEGMRLQMIDLKEIIEPIVVKMYGTGFGNGDQSGDQEDDQEEEDEDEHEHDPGDEGEL